VTSIDLDWFKLCHSRGLIQSPFLEIGSARVNRTPNLCDAARELGLPRTVGVDLEKTDGVDYVCDFSLCPREFQKQPSLGVFSSVCIFNVLEHTFEPTIVFSNALSCVAERGALLVVVPSVWPIHNYPGDYNRLLPDWYSAVAKRHGLNLVPDLFCWLSQFGIERISSFEPDLPTYISRRNKLPQSRYWLSRIAHKVFNTYGRNHWATHSAIGAVCADRLRKVSTPVGKSNVTLCLWELNASCSPDRLKCGFTT
jgi:hypothetical protein